MVEVATRDISVRLLTTLRRRAQEALRSSPIYELRDLRVEQQNGRFILSGTVSSFYYKQLAQELVRARCKGDDIDLVNMVRVRETS
jgi:osmotically-inducible protein OsmY